MTTSQKHKDNSRAVALLITLFISGALLVCLLVTRLSMSYVPLIGQHNSEITMVEIPDDNEFVEVEVADVLGGETDPLAPALADEDVENESQLAPESGVSNRTQGQVGETQQTVTQTKPAPVQDTPKPSSTKPAATVDNKKQEEQAMAARTQSTVKNAFANSANRNNATNGATDNGPDGTKTGKSDSSAPHNATGQASGTVGGSWKMPTYSNKIPSNEIGSVTFEVQVNRDGSVGKITPISNTGLTSATLNRCIAEIKKHKFTHGNPEIAQAATARVKFTFRDPN